MDENKLQERDDRVSAAVQRAIDEHYEEAERLRNEAREHLVSAGTIRRAVLAGEWWKLRGILSAADVESLCQCGLTDRSGYLTTADE